MIADHLIETSDLAARIDADDAIIRIVDMRGVVKTRLVAEGVQSAEYAGARSEYEAGHIPGALYIDWTRDIVDETDPVPVQAATAERVQAVFEELGIGDEHLIIAYDAHPASQFATRLWWLLQLHGHPKVRVLNGGWAKWLREQRPISRETPRYPRTRFTPRPNDEWCMTADEVSRLIGNPNAAIIDARDEEQYTGRIRRGSRGGHIPGAIHVSRDVLFEPDGTFKDPGSLEREFDLRGVPSDRKVVAYCNGGVAATSVLFALSMLDRRDLANYDGSWNEWAERPELPVETG